MARARIARGFYPVVVPADIGIPPRYGRANVKGKTTSPEMRQKRQPPAAKKEATTKRQKRTAEVELIKAKKNKNEARIFNRNEPDKSLSGRSVCESKKKNQEKKTKILKMFENFSKKSVGPLGGPWGILGGPRENV